MQTALLLAAAPASWDDPLGGRAQCHVLGWGVGPRFRPRAGWSGPQRPPRRGAERRAASSASSLAQLCPPLCEAFRSCWPELHSQIPTPSSPWAQLRRQLLGGMAGGRWVLFPGPWSRAELPPCPLLCLTLKTPGPGHASSRALLSPA